jgi:gluconate 5-dehydrogenase
LKKPAVDTSPDEFQAVLQTHVVAAFALTRAVLPGMTARGHGNILFTASMTSLFGIPLVVAYSAAKAAYLGMVRSLAAEVSGQGVRVNAVAPGWIESDMLRQALSGDPERAKKVLGRTPMGRLGEPDDIGWAATYLCSPAAKFVTGVVLPVDGGASIGF